MRAIASVRRFDDIETVQLVIIDGGSDEYLIDEIKAVLSSHDILISERDDGIFDGLNKGLHHATGDLIGWLGSDDIFHTEVKASEIVEVLKYKDIYVGGTAMVDQDQIKRVFWLPNNPRKAALYGLHNPHFSTFGRAEVLRRAQFDLTSPVADIGYFLDVFATNPSVATDHRLVTLQQIGGFSNGSIMKSIRYNFLTYAHYRKHTSPTKAVIAALFKLVPKILSTAYFNFFSKTISDPLLCSIK